MRKILLGIGLLVLGWSAYWLWGAQSLSREVTGWLDTRQAEGWQAEAGDISVTGYPLRFDTELRDLALADPETGIAWQTPSFTFTQQALQPARIAVRAPDLPQAHVLRTPTQRLTLRHDALAIDLRTRPERALPLEDARLTAATLTVEAGDGGVTSLADLAGRMERVTETGYEITLLAEGLALSGPLLRGLGGDLPETLERATLEMHAEFDRRWDLRAIDTARPQPTALELRVLEANWGRMALRMSADLEIDPRGVPTGSVSVQARDWQAMLEVATRSGAVPDALAGPLQEGLRFLAGLSGNRDALDVDLRLERGQIFVGFIPVGPAPLLRLR